MSIRVNREPAQSLKGGVIMDVVTPEQAKIAEAAGAVAVMALERVPADIRAQGGVARMSDPGMIAEIQEAVSIPVMAKARIGHFVEAQILAELGIDFIDESEVLTPADYVNHINKWELSIPTLCGATNLGEALRRIAEGAAMIRSKGEAGTGDVSEAVRHLRTILNEIHRLRTLDKDELFVAAQGSSGPLRSGAGGGGDREVAGANVCGRWRVYPGGCCPGDADWCGGRVCGLRHFQVGQPGKAGPGNR